MEERGRESEREGEGKKRGERGNEREREGERKRERMGEKKGGERQHLQESVFIRVKRPNSPSEEFQGTPSLPLSPSSLPLSFPPPSNPNVRAWVSWRGLFRYSSS